ncbi:11851_t:CDS:2 [Diversispora eburnea]|uniref:11851_t:CDS:1 n=1 Tax=Diversispora eburnea TaxID=1213867 RepID=A0A9N9F657_9GLOM|nr:11851_t:CDS:2 [Diversispora eburnea]
MSLSYSKKDSLKSALEGRFIKEFDYNTFENITEIAKGGFGKVYRANSTNLEKHVALKSLHGNDELFYERFVREVTSGARETPVNKTPKDYVNIYLSAWNDDSNQRPSIENIFDSLENIELENVYDDSNDNQDVQLETNINNQSQASSKDSVSIPTSFTTPNWGEVTEYDYNDFKNLKNIGKGAFGMIYSATLMNLNGMRTVALKSIVVATMELFVNEVNTN